MRCRGGCVVVWISEKWMKIKKLRANEIQDERMREGRMNPGDSATVEESLRWWLWNPNYRKQSQKWSCNNLSPIAGILPSVLPHETFIATLYGLNTRAASIAHFALSTNEKRRNTLFWCTYMYETLREEWRSLYRRKYYVHTKTTTQRRVCIVAVISSLAHGHILMFTVTLYGQYATINDNGEMVKKKMSIDQVHKRMRDKT